VILLFKKYLKRSASSYTHFNSTLNQLLTFKYEHNRILKTNLSWTRQKSNSSDAKIFSCIYFYRSNLYLKLDFSTQVWVLGLSRYLDQEQRRDLFGLREKLPPVTPSLIAHRRGKWGGARGAPWRYFGPPWTIFAPLRLLSWAIFGTKNAPEKTLFGWFWVKSTLCPVQTFFFFFRERWIVVQKMRWSFFFF